MPVRTAVEVDSTGQAAPPTESSRLVTHGMLEGRPRMEPLAVGTVMLKKPLTYVVLWPTTVVKMRKLKHISVTRALGTPAPGQLPFWVQQSWPVTLRPGRVETNKVAWARWLAMAKRRRERKRRGSRSTNSGHGNAVF